MYFKIRILEKDSDIWRWGFFTGRGETFEKSFNLHSYANTTGIHNSNPFSESVNDCDPESIVKCMNSFDNTFFENLQAIQIYYIDAERWDENGEIFVPEFMVTIIRNPHTEKLGRISFYISEKRKYDKYPTNKYSND